MTKYIKTILYSTVILSASFYACNFKKSENVKKTCVFSKIIDSTHTIKKSSETIGIFGDCKLIDFQNEVYIVANLNSKLSIRKIGDANTSFKSTKPTVSSSWFDIIEDNGSVLCVTASLQDKSLRLYKIDMQSLKVYLIVTVAQYNEQLIIDPTLIKVKEKYFITYTQIKGNINNGDILKPNGHYEVVLLESKDLIHWKKVSSIVSEDTNIEDGFLYYCAYV